MKVVASLELRRQVDDHVTRREEQQEEDAIPAARVGERDPVMAAGDVAAAVPIRVQGLARHHLRRPVLHEDAPAAAARPIIILAHPSRHGGGGGGEDDGLVPVGARAARRSKEAHGHGAAAAAAAARWRDDCEEAHGHTAAAAGPRRVGSLRRARSGGHAASRSAPVQPGDEAGGEAALEPRRRGADRLPAYGLGRDARSGSYKVARFFYREVYVVATGTLGITTGMEVFTVGDGRHCWRETAAQPTHPVLPERTATFFHANSCLLWTVQQQEQDDDEGFLRFSLEDETTFGFMPPPPYRAGTRRPVDRAITSSLSELRGASSLLLIIISWSCGWPWTPCIRDGSNVTPSPSPNPGWLCLSRWPASPT